MNKKNKYILWFSEVDKDDIPLVGGKGANLGEMAAIGLPVPRGFIVTSKAYFDFLEQNKLKSKIYQGLKNLDLADPQSLNIISQRIKKLIEKGEISNILSKEIIHNYLKLGGIISHAWVAIRSSATAEDLPTASFAGQQVTFLNVSGEANVVKRVQDCWASLFEPRAIFYREEKGFDHFKVGMAVPVQEMVPAEVSGVMFTVDPVTSQKNRIVIEAIYGLGEYLVQGIVSPDRYTVDKGSLEIIKKEISKQTIQLTKVGSLNQETGVPKKLQLKRKLTDGQIVNLAKLGKRIHNHYFYPQDIEWTFYKNKFWIVQTRPVTTLIRQPTDQGKPKETRKPILKGQAASPGIASGPVKKILTAKEISKVKKGEILVTIMTSPDFVPAMKKVVAIITDKGGQTSHAAIVSRELGIPCVVGTEIATKALKNSQIVTINGSKGEVYRGGVGGSALRALGELETVSTKRSDQPFPPSEAIKHLKTATKIYVNLGEPQLAEEVAQQNADGVGLLRAEFMIAQFGVHPKKIIKERKQKLFVDKMCSNLSIFCEHFYPRPVVYRATDFKTNEYRNLIGGKSFEPEEENPLLGYRGAYRYISDSAVFELELRAIKEVRQKFKNLWLMIPFVHTPQELKEVKKLIVASGLMRGPSFKLWLMVELPANVILLEDFIKVGIDGVSIGSNDLTMLILGIDRDNAELAQVFNEQDPAVLWALKRTIKTCQKYKITSSICGQAPSVYPDLVEKLVGWGITSISVNPDAIDRTRELVYEVEGK
jgi:pyruvate,water dikinase